MKLIKSSFEIIDQLPGLEGIYKHVEYCGRTSYQSYNKITENSYKDFYKMIIKNGHLSVCEHGTVYLKYTIDGAYNTVINDNWIEEVYGNNPYSFVTCDNKYYYIMTNLRVILENSLDDNSFYDHLCAYEETPFRRVTVKFILPISISREFIRSRCMSFTEMSTRYCNFNSDKFDNEITFIIPYWTNLREGRYQYEDNDWVDVTNKDKIPNIILKHFEGDSTDIFLSECDAAETNYKVMIEQGLKPQEAREILPLCTKTELVMTGSIEQWKGFFRLRCDKAAHPQARELATGVKKEFIKRGYINESE